MSVSGGQPKIQEWERVRVMAWTELVRRLAQTEMEKHLARRLTTESKFYPSALSIAHRWNAPQRKTQFPNTITMTDLGAIFLGNKNGTETRTDFSAYSKGSNARPKLSVLESVNQSLPGTLDYFQIGPYGLPLWQAFKGEADQQNFWSPLLTSCVFDGREWLRKKNLNKGMDDDLWDKSGLMAISHDEWLKVLSSPATEAAPQKLFGQAVIFAKITCSLATSAESEDLNFKQDLLDVASKFAAVWPYLDIAYGKFKDTVVQQTEDSMIEQFIARRLATIDAHLKRAQSLGLL